MTFKILVFEGWLRVIVMVLEVDADSKRILGSTAFLSGSCHVVFGAVWVFPLFSSHSQKHAH